MGGPPLCMRFVLDYMRYTYQLLHGSTHRCAGTKCMVIIYVFKFLLDTLVIYILYIILCIHTHTCSVWYCKVTLFQCIYMRFYISTLAAYLYWVLPPTLLCTCSCHHTHANADAHACTHTLSYTYAHSCMYGQTFLSWLSLPTTSNWHW